MTTNPGSSIIVIRLLFNPLSKIFFSFFLDTIAENKLRPARFLTKKHHTMPSFPTNTGLTAYISEYLEVIVDSYVTQFSPDSCPTTHYRGLIDDPLLDLQNTLPSNSISFTTDQITNFPKSFHNNIALGRTIYQSMLLLAFFIPIANITTFLLAGKPPITVIHNIIITHFYQRILHIQGISMLGPTETALYIKHIAKIFFNFKSSFTEFPIKFITYTCALSESFITKSRVHHVFLSMFPF